MTFYHHIRQSLTIMHKNLSIRGMSSAKRNGNIWDMLKNQSKAPSSVKCPACEVEIPKSKLDWHLDVQCSSASKSSTSSSDNPKGETLPDLDVSKIANKSNKDFRTARWSPNVSNMMKRKASQKNTGNANVEKRSKFDVSVASDTDEKMAQDSNIPENDLDKDGVDQPQISQYSPYYIANFKEIVGSVLADANNEHLFSSDDLNVVNKFNSLSGCSQKLYVRLFQRKYKWLRPMKIIYPQIAEDLTCYLKELADQKFLDSGTACIDLETALELLTLGEIKALSKHFNLNASTKSKHEISQLLIKHGKQHKSFFSCNGQSTVTLAILKRVKQVVGPCYRLSLEPKRLFARILMLFSLPTISEDDEEAAGGQQQQLFTFLQVKKGELKFPEYNMTRKFKIFSNREELIGYEVARDLENDILNAIESKKFDLAKELYLNARKEFLSLKESGVVKKDSEMPFFLRRYTARHVYVRCLNQGVEALQRLRLYEEAVVQLWELLNQSIYCQDRRGKWYDRVALNLEQHLKQPEKAAEAIKLGLRDSYVRVGPRFSLLMRAERIASAKNCSDEQLKDCLKEMYSVTEAPKVTVRGRLLPRPIPGRRHIFISSGLDPEKPEDVSVVSVEQLAIEHYKTVGYSEGLHGEGSTFVSIYALLFWDVIYDGSIPDVFISPYQTHPLDLNSDDFYCSRKENISSQLSTVKNADEQELKDIIKSTWDAHHGVVSLVSWDLFTDIEHVQGLVSCLGSDILAGICERIAKDFRFTRSGVPDLVVWNPETKIVKIVEVKGPGDKLSSKQILWLDHLLKLGADAEVCLVEAVGSKKLKKQ